MIVVDLLLDIRSIDALDEGHGLHQNGQVVGILGLALDAMGNTEAFAAFERSNKGMIDLVGEQNLNAPAFLHEVAALKTFFSPGKLAALAETFATDDDFQPVFFVGFPRRSDRQSLL